MKHIFYSLIYFICFFIPNNGLLRAEENQTPLIDEAFQKIPGCPINSQCDEVMGKKRTEWLKYLQGNNLNTVKSTKRLDSFRSKKGILIDVWLSSLEIPHAPLIGWDSFCQNHRHKNKQLFYQGKIFAKSYLNSRLNIMGKSSPLKSINGKQAANNIFLDPIVLKQKGKIMTYWVPAKDVPYAIENNNILLLRQDEGEYYTLSISPKGKWKIIKTNPNHLATSFKTTCPQELLQHADKMKLPKDLYKITTCKSIKNIINKKDVIFLSKWSCSS